MLRQIIILLLLAIGSLNIFAQSGNSISSTVNIIPKNRAYDNMLPFKGEGEIRDSLPVFRFRVKLPHFINPPSIKLSLSDLLWSPDNDPFIKIYPNIFEDPKSYVVSMSKESFLEIELVPFAKINGASSRLESFNYNIQYELQTSTQLKSNEFTERYAANSVLASGKWLKISIDETGIHKIPYSTLSGWGFATPSEVRVFGHGGEMLPKINAEARPDDLPELAIWHYNNAIYFYGQGPVFWKYNTLKKMFLYQKHDFEDDAYYFLTDLDGSVKTVQNQPIETRAFNYTSQHFDDLKYHEQDLKNLINSGRRWYGESLSQLDGLSKEINFTFPSRDVSLPIKIGTRVVARDNRQSNFEIKVNDRTSASINHYVPAISFSDYVSSFAYENEGTATLTEATNDIKVNVSLLNTSSTVTGWLDYVFINARCNLQLSEDQLLFRDKSSEGTERITLFKIGNATNETVVWDVTNRNSAEKVAAEINTSTLEFKTATSASKSFIAFNPSGQLPVPALVGSVENQNLHATEQVDYIIVAPKEFSAQANQLANLHEQQSGLTWVIVTPEAIYNEFSYGHKDVTAIRSFVKMFYDRAGFGITDAPKYLLLFGDGSYNNRTSDPANKSHIITYQSENSVHRTSSYVTDDFFGFLDDSEGVDDRIDRPDIGIGRFPVKNVTEAQVAVDKVKAYIENQKPGAWGKLLTFIADDEDSNIHMRDANLLAEKVEIDYPQFDIKKIYLDNYKKITTSTGKKFPDAEDAITRTISEGTLLFNYVGHGSDKVLSAEQIITIGKIINWNNIRNLPVFVTATCDFSRFDDPLFVSAGEETFLNPNGGAIALLSTTRIVYSSLNYTLNNAFFNYVFSHDLNGDKPALGDIMRLTKGASGTSINKLNFILLGDPALKLRYPENQINLVKINNKTIEELSDTLSALSKVTLEAEIVKPDGTLMQSYNGTADITVYDKSMDVKTLGNDGNTPFEFNQFTNVIFKGKATVTNGRFASEFIVPYDIRYNFDPGRISLYAFSAESGEAFGANNEVIIGGFDGTAPEDYTGPDVDLYLNHESFKAGEKTGTAPLLYVKINDISGINTSGNGIGHDITLIIDGKKEQPIILNNYFQATTDSYQSGIVIFQLPTLSNGRHEISFKVWDTYNNSSTIDTYFTVGDEKELTIRDFKLYPNPITIGGNLQFVFTTDEANTTLSITVESINSTGGINGKSVLQIVASGNYIDPIPLSLSALGMNTPGINFIRFTITANTGKQTQIIQKILVRP